MKHELHIDSFDKLAEECRQLAQMATNIAQSESVDCSSLCINETDCDAIIEKYNNLQHLMEPIVSYAKLLKNPQIADLTPGMTIWWVCKTLLRGWHVSKMSAGDRYTSPSGEECIYLYDIPYAHTTHGVPLSYIGKTVFLNSDDAAKALTQLTAQDLLEERKRRARRIPKFPKSKEK